jgi:predicted RNase H-like HicB family nuclease
MTGMTDCRKLAALATAPRFRSSAVLRVQFDREEHGRWIAEIPQLPGVLAYGATKSEAFLKPKTLAFRVLADSSETHKIAPKSVRFE